MKEKDCIFCKIADGIIPSHKIYEDDDVLAFLDISQVTKGHALVISKKHYDNFLTVLYKVPKNLRRTSSTPSGSNFKLSQGSELVII